MVCDQLKIFMFAFRLGYPSRFLFKLSSVSATNSQAPCQAPSLQLEMHCLIGDTVHADTVGPVIGLVSAYARILQFQPIIFAY